MTDATLAPSALQFQDARPDDLPAMLAIERVAHLTPWTEGNFRDSFAAGHLVLLAREAGALGGYAVSMLVLDEAHLLTIAVAPSMRRRGIGRALFAAWRARMRAAGAMRIYLEVRGGNAAARALYAAEGLIEIGRRKDYYGFPGDVTRREDAVVMASDV